MVGKIHPEEVKATHWFPTIFLMGTVLLFLLPFLSTLLFTLGLSLFILYLTAIFVDALASNRNVMVGILSIPAALCQLFGYGMGFLTQKLRGN